MIIQLHYDWKLIWKTWTNIY